MPTKVPTNVLGCNLTPTVGNDAKTVDIGRFRSLQLQTTMGHDSNAGYWTSLAVLRADGFTLATGIPVRPVAWRAGDDAHNLRELLLSS